MPEPKPGPRGRTAFDRFAERASDVVSGAAFFTISLAVVVAGTQTIEPTVTNEEEAEVLGVPLHSPAFLFERTSTSDRGEVVEFVRSIYRGDRYRLVTELRPALRDR